jgi:hypothetical protein
MDPLDVLGEEHQLHRWAGQACEESSKHFAKRRGATSKLL